MELKSNWFRYTPGGRAWQGVYSINYDEQKSHYVVSWSEERGSTEGDGSTTYAPETVAKNFKTGTWTACDEHGALLIDPPVTATTDGEHTGGSVNYYKVQIDNPTSGGSPYMAECNDIIEALGMNYAEGNVFKAIWRRCASRNLGKKKKGNNALYDAEKTVFFAERILEQEKRNAESSRKEG